MDGMQRLGSIVRGDEMVKTTKQRQPKSGKNVPASLCRTLIFCFGYHVLDMQKYLQKWIRNYVDGDPANSTEETKARKPLAAAEVVVEEVEGNPGYYTSKFYLRPHYQLEGLTVSLRLVSRLPSQKSA